MALATGPNDEEEEQEEEEEEDSVYSLPLGIFFLLRPREKWEDNIQMDVKKLEWNGKRWVYLAEEKDNFNVLKIL